MNVISWLDSFDDRQRKEIEFCRLYARQFKHGTDGHNAKIIIARMAELLDEQLQSQYRAMPIDDEDLDDTLRALHFGG